MIEDVKRDDDWMLGSFNEAWVIVDSKIVLEPENSGAISATFCIVCFGRRERKRETTVESKWGSGETESGSGCVGSGGG